MGESSKLTTLRFRAIRHHWSSLVALALLTSTFVVPFYLMTGKSVTYDEVAHIPAGYSYLRTGEIHLNPMHPPLIKEICALPLLFLNLELPIRSEVLASSPVGYQWEFSRRFLDRPDLRRIVFWTRLPAVLLSVGLAVVIFSWSRTLWGTGGGVLALSLYAFDPTITAHAQLVTTDVGIAFFSTLFLFVLRRYVLTGSWIALVSSGVILGLALGTKFSGVVLLPIAALLLVLSMRTFRRKDLLAAAGRFGVMGMIAYVVLWVIYLFPDDPLFYVNGIGTLGADHPADHYFFLMGEFRKEGWLHYFLVAWLVKTPLPSLFIVAAAVICAAVALRAKPLDEIFLLIPLGAFFAAYSLFSAPQGVRYLIPCYPFLYVFSGRLASAASGLRFARVALVSIVAWLIVEFVTIWPDHLTYFNQIVGGPRGGVRWLDDSNVDWGQGLLQLRDYVREEGIEEPRVCAFWHLDPRRYDIPVTPIEIRELVLSRPEGTVILSSHCVARAGGLLRIAHGDKTENWIAHVEPERIVGHVYYVYRLGRDARPRE